MYIEDSKYARRITGRVDILGIGLLAVGLGCLQTVLERGERDDWFQAGWIVWSTITATIALISFVAWELSPRNKAPVVDFHVLRVRSFAAGMPMAFALGMGLYGGVFIFPVFAQNLLHFTAQETGLVLLPGGLATGVSMIICGRMVRKYDPRPLIIFGFSLFIYSMIALSRMTLASGIEDTYVPLILRGFGLGFMFIPLTVASVQTLPRKDIAQGTALYNLFRQLGGSFGIAILNTMIQHDINVHRSDLVGYVNSGSPELHERLNAQIGVFSHLGYSLDAATNMAYGSLDNIVNMQAMNLAYNDAFRFLSVIFIVVAPLLLFLKRPKMPGAPPDAH